MLYEYIFIASCKIHRYWNLDTLQEARTLSAPARNAHNVAKPVRRKGSRFQIEMINWTKKTQIIWNWSRTFYPSKFSLMLINSESQSRQFTNSNRLYLIFCYVTVTVTLRTRRMGEMKWWRNWRWEGEFRRKRNFPVSSSAWAQSDPSDPGIFYGERLGDGSTQFHRVSWIEKSQRNRLNCS